MSRSIRKLLVMLLLLPAYVRGQIITSVAGDDSTGCSGFGGSAMLAPVGSPRNVAVDANGNIYIPCWAPSNVLKVDTFGTITIFAGNCSAGYSGDGGPATMAKIAGPTSIAFDGIGNVYIADASNGRVRVVNTDGIISTIAGNGSGGFSGDGGSATDAGMGYPNGLAFDSKGNLYITTQYESRVRIVNTSGIINTFAGSGTAGYSGDGGPATLAKINNPCRIAIDQNDNVYIDDWANNVIRKVDTTGIISTFAGNHSMGFSGDGGPATAATLRGPLGVAVDRNGNLYIADWNNNRVRKVNTSGVISTIAGTGSSAYSGDGGPATAAGLSSTTGVAVDKCGNIYVSDFSDNHIRKVSVISCEVDSNDNTNTNDSNNNNNSSHLDNGSCTLTLPSAFTPNSDGLNDLFRPITKNDSAINNYTFVIFNRWGQRVFLSNDPSIGWDGKYQNVYADVGTYFYYIDCLIGSNNYRCFKKGDVTLIR